MISRAFIRGVGRISGTLCRFLTVQGCRIYKLETNYRSVPEILEVANACIAGNPQQYQKDAQGNTLGAPEAAGLENA